MTAKEELIEFINEQPDNISAEDLARALKLYIKLTARERAHRNSEPECVPHDEMMRMFGRL